jgi:hypothetical protein
MGQKLIIVDDAISIDVRTKEKTTIQNLNLTFMQQNNSKLILMKTEGDKIRKLISTIGPYNAGW